ncbi:MAG: hypothetical protein M3Y27_04595 [Acidobacteriota bacterium]|nr:hypothetical protein [Acidobacteriota bacterium]
MTIGSGVTEVTITNARIALPGCPPNCITFVNDALVSQQAAAGTLSYVTYRADLLNLGSALGSVMATLTSLDPFSVR